MEFPALEKFIETMGIDIRYGVERDFITPRGKRYVCIEVIAYHKNRETYIQYHCYETTNNGFITYEDGNDVMGASDGVFAYLNMDKEVNKYFEQKARNFAKSVFKN